MGYDEIEILLPVPCPCVHKMHAEDGGLGKMAHMSICEDAWVWGVAWVSRV